MGLGWRKAAEKSIRPATLVAALFTGMAQIPPLLDALIAHLSDMKTIVGSGILFAVVWLKAFAYGAIKDR